MREGSGHSASGGSVLLLRLVPPAGRVAVRSAGCGPGRLVCLPRSKRTRGSSAEPTLGEHA